MDIPNWLVVFVIVAIIVAAFARSIGEIRLEQISGPVDREDGGPYSPAVNEGQLPDTMSEDQKELKELLDARDAVQRQIEILATEMYPTKETRRLIEQLRATLSELNGGIATETDSTLK